MTDTHTQEVRLAFETWLALPPGQQTAGADGFRQALWQTLPTEIAPAPFDAENHRDAERALTALDRLWSLPRSDWHQGEGAALVAELKSYLLAPAVPPTRDLSASADSSPVDSATLWDTARLPVLWGGMALACAALLALRLRRSRQERKARRRELHRRRRAAYLAWQASAAPLREGEAVLPEPVCDDLLFAERPSVRMPLWSRSTSGD